MRRNAKTDGNQTEIVRALRAVGAKVLHLHTVGNDCPDLLVGHRGKNVLLEVKKERGARISKGQAAFFASWPGEAYIVQTVHQALEAVLGKEAMR